MSNPLKKAKHIKTKQAYLDRQFKRAKIRLSEERRQGQKRSRRQETRRKIIVGVYFVHSNLHAFNELVQKMDGFLAREYDRILFGLSDGYRPQRSTRADEIKILILVGAFFLEQYQNRESELTKLIEPVLTRDKDRALFDLKPIGYIEKDRFA